MPAITGLSTVPLNGWVNPYSQATEGSNSGSGKASVTGTICRPTSCAEVS